MILFACSFLTLLAILIVKACFKPLPSLKDRIYPYNVTAKIHLSGNNSTQTSPPTESVPTFIALFNPIKTLLIKIIFNSFTKGKDEKLALQLRQAESEQTLEQYKATLVKKFAIGSGVGSLMGVGLHSVKWVFFFSIVGGIISFSKSHAKLEKIVQAKKTTIRMELSTIDQLLAIYIQTGSGVTQAISQLTKRTQGQVSKELKLVLARVSNGIPIEDSLLTAAKTTPEPHAQRTYKLLASASSRGTNLSQGLLDLAQDLRRNMREEIRTTGAKRRAAMLLPTIGILSPIMLLFVATPIPSIVLTR